MFGLNITALPEFRYKISLIKWNQIQWSTECAEIDLEETVAKVLRISSNLRQLPTQIATTTIGLIAK